MSLNVGGAVFGVAVLTVIANSVTNNTGGQDSLQARVRGYQASYYGAIAWAVLATLISTYLLWSNIQKSRESESPIAGTAEVEDKNKEDKPIKEAEPGVQSISK